MSVTRSRSLLAWCLGLLTVLCMGCKDDGLTGVRSTLRFEPEVLEFDPVFADGVTRLREVVVVNEGRAAVEVTWSGLSAPFTMELPAQLPPGPTPLIIRFTPTVPGRFSQRLEVKSPQISNTDVVLSLEASARESSFNCVALSAVFAALMC